MFSQKEIRFAILLGTLLLIILLLIVVFAIVHFRIRQVRHQKEKQILESQFFQTLLQSQLEIQEQTFEHVSKEIHDNLGQVASLIKINLNTLQLHERQKAEENIKETKELVRHLILDLKLLSLNLSSERITAMGLIKLLETDIERINKTGLFSIKLQQEGISYRLEKDKEIILYRMSQEILNNMVKHSQAVNVYITLKFTKKSFILDFIDDGIGFNAEEMLKEGVKRGSTGLHNLQKRSALINANLTVESSPRKGTNIRIELPL